MIPAVYVRPGWQLRNARSASNQKVGSIVSRFSRRLAFLLFVPIIGLAQDRGTIRGTVTDQSTAAVPEAVVTVRNIDTGLVQTVRTGTDGVYNVLYLPVGNYTVSTSKPGFRKAESTGIRVNVNTVVG